MGRSGRRVIWVEGAPETGDVRAAWRGCAGAGLTLLAGVMILPLARSTGSGVLRALVWTLLVVAPFAVSFAVILLVTSIRTRRQLIRTHPLPPGMRIRVTKDALEIFHDHGRVAELARPVPAQIDFADGQLVVGEQRYPAKHVDLEPIRAAAAELGWFDAADPEPTLQGSTRVPTRWPMLRYAAPATPEIVPYRARLDALQGTAVLHDPRAWRVRPLPVRAVVVALCVAGLAVLEPFSRSVDGFTLALALWWVVLPLTASLLHDGFPYGRARGDARWSLTVDHKTATVRTGSTGRHRYVFRAKDKLTFDPGSSILAGPDTSVALPGANSDDVLQVFRNRGWSIHLLERRASR